MFNNVNLKVASYEDIKNFVQSRYPHDMLKAREVASLLEISISTVRLWDKLGLLKGVQFRKGGAMRWPSEQVSTFIFNKIQEIK